jgi:hypothetical protein
MSSRILLSAVAAAALLGVAPTLAAEDPAPREGAACCCPQGPMHERHHARAELQPDPRRDAAQRAESDDPDVRNQSYGG